MKTNVLYVIFSTIPVQNESYVIPRGYLSRFGHHLLMSCHIIECNISHVLGGRHMRFCNNVVIFVSNIYVVEEIDFVMWYKKTSVHLLSKNMLGKTCLLFLKKCTKGFSFVTKTYDKFAIRGCSNTLIRYF